MLCQYLLIGCWFLSGAHGTLPNTRRLRTIEAGGGDVLLPVPKKRKTSIARPVQSSDTDLSGVYGDHEPMAVDSRKAPVQHGILRQRSRQNLLLWSTPDYQIHVLKRSGGLPVRVASIKKDLILLLDPMAQLTERLSHILDRMGSKESSSILEAAETFINSEKKIEMMVQLKLFELGESALTMEEVQQLFAVNRDADQKMTLAPILHPDDLQRECQRQGESFLEEMKAMKDKLIIAESDFYLDKVKATSSLVMEYFCQVVDLLYKNKFVKRDSVRSAFGLEEAQKLEQLSDYIYSKFWKQTRDTIYNSQIGITQHWYLRILNKSFEAFGAKEQMILDLSVWVRNLKFYGRVSFRKKVCWEWSNFKKSFSMDKFIKMISDSQLVKNPEYFAGHSAKFHEQAKHYDNTEDVQNLVELIFQLTKNNLPLRSSEQWLLNISCKLLHFIDQALLPGIMGEKSSRTVADVGRFEAKIGLILLHSRIKDTIMLKKQFQSFIRLQNPKSLKLEDNEKIDIYDHYRNQIIGLTEEYKKAYSEAMKDKTLSSWLSNQKRMELDQ
ncbi:hypothetical protein PGT21_019027 [Puccinia graminis f. sp. tritici]|uniref:Uncharacterized protein n=1 Tax=Puccinia graminis f. sp. tritici TaxID=56615 RepID=A0A5B0QV17_PUCGR|nr:hypothetical protein PGT21_019027 [Puccinia graminis f. sp. tritici]